jgi:hypothetical protein
VLGSPLIGRCLSGLSGILRLAGRGEVGAVCTNCAKGVTPAGMLDRQTAAGKVSVFGDKTAFPWGEGGTMGEFVCLDLAVKYPPLSIVVWVIPSEDDPCQSTLFVGFFKHGISCPVSAACDARRLFSISKSAE